jgi:hypothetical protein
METEQSPMLSLNADLPPQDEVKLHEQRVDAE